MCLVIQSDIPGSFIDKNMHYERTGQMGAEKYLGETCYHYIKCSVVSYLATLMRK